MATRRYDFLTGIETPSIPVTTPADSPGDAFVLGNYNSFTIVNNQGSAASITDLVLDKAGFRSALVRFHIFRSSVGGQTRAQSGLFEMINDGTNWELAPLGSGTVPNTGDCGVEFTITSAGQVQYTSDDNGGAYVAANSILLWKFMDVTEV